MKRGLIEQMLSGMDDKYIQEAVETQGNHPFSECADWRLQLRHVS